jgi:[heparan sulfate]-glucosamine 3-sulfotransferase 4
MKSINELILIGVRETDFATDPLKRFPCVVDHRLPQALRCLGKTKGRTHPLVDPSILDRLRRFYHKNDERLFALLKRRFSWQL